jgi:hypothetical protein
MAGEVRGSLICCLAIYDNWARTALIVQGLRVNDLKELKGMGCGRFSPYE